MDNQGYEEEGKLVADQEVTDSQVDASVDTTDAPTAETQPPAAPPQPQIDPIQLMWMQQQQMQQQMQQLQQYNAYLAAQIQARQQSAAPAQPEEPEPDISTEPEKYVEWKTNRLLRQQYAPIQSQLQQMQQQQAYMQVMQRANELTQNPNFADYKDYYQTILQMANNIPLDELAKPGSLELLYYTAKGYHANQANQQKQQQAQAPSPAAPQGQWPGAKMPPPPVSGGSTVGAPAAPTPKKVILTPEQKMTARKAGMTEEEYAKYL